MGRFIDISVQRP